ncbi:flagellar hook-length control protein FliK [Geomonas subterranea]|uniref:flagellar hook-length control protein FliK n=1 Tax=Geomonas subterranea TaxID=2847989 RepID=UPI001CD37425|nr:flagellar hook-length control protein FliK [Geomonas fuzhouensis]
MMVQNAAFIPDAIPAPAAQSGMATAAAAPGAGVFQQLLQGRQTPAENTARPAPEKTPKTSPRPARAEEKNQAPETRGARDGLPAQATHTPAAEKAAVENGKLQARKADPEKETSEPARDAGAEATSGNVAQAGTEQAAPAMPEASATGQAGDAATGTVPETQPDPNPGLVVAMAALESNMAARSEDANAEAGSTALERLQALQQGARREPAATGDGVESGAQPELPQQAAPQRNQQQQTTTGTAGIALGQKAEPAELSQVVSSTGATEGAQVEKPQAQVAQGVAERQQGPGQLPDAAKTVVTADQTVAAAHLAAKETGAGRFVAMPVRKQAEPATAAGPATTPATAGQENAPAQQDAALPQDATQQVQAADATAATAAKSAGATVAPAKAEAAASELKAQPEQQGAPGQAEQAPQAPRKDAHGEAVPGKQVREAAQAQQGNVSTAPGEELSGTKNATTATAKPVPEAGAVREMSGAQSEQGQSHQKGEQSQNGQMLGAGLTAQAAPAEVAQAETRQAGGKSFLHESILSQVREGVVTHDGKGNGQMSIRLNPGELGELKIQLRMENNRLNVEVQADNRMVKDLLMSNLDSLRESLSGKNLTMEGFNVSTGGGGFNAPLNEERGNQQQHQPQRFARGAGYDGQDAPRVNYLTAEVNNLLDVRF